MQFIPGHRGVSGNEAADSAAKATHLLRYRTLTPYSKEETVSLACKAFRTRWDSTWLQQVRVTGKGRHLVQIRDTSGIWSWASHRNRRVETALARLRVGHTGFRSHLFRFNQTCLCVVNLDTSSKTSAPTSEKKVLKLVVPQGAVLSPLLFNIMMYDTPVVEGICSCQYLGNALVFCSDYFSVGGATTSRGSNVSSTSTGLVTDVAGRIRPAGRSLVTPALEVVTDRGAQFESELFSKLSSLLGFHHVRTTSYHPQSNGLVERLHRTLKTAIMARQQNGFHSLPIVLLGLRMTPNAAGFSPFTAVSGTMMLCPQPVISRDIHKTTSPELLQTFLSEMQSIDFRQCSEGTCHSSPPSYVPPDLQTCDKVWLRVDRVRKSLEAPYTGPFEVLKRSPKTFTLKLPQGDSTVSIDRLKPAYVAPTIKQLPNPSVSPANPSVSPAKPSVSPANPSVSPATPSVSLPTAAHFNSSPPVLPPAAPSSPSETARSPSSTRTRSGRTVRFK
ncbi:Integrase catalytic core [Trinorchestia longiramus]|nr:Integrase catalytic core [Trinorchestia longiramus]